MSSAKIDELEIEVEIRALEKRHRRLKVIPALRGDPQLVAREMQRLHRVAHRVVWANPRTRHPGYRPLVGGMAAAMPFCDAVVSAHSLDALGDLLAALGG